MFAASKTNSASTGGYQISRSLRFNSADSAYLNRTPSTTTNRRTFTFSAWVKFSKTSDDPFLMGAGSGGQIWVVGDKIRVRLNGSPDYYYDTAAVFRDYSAWYHIVVGVDTTNATSADRVKIYVNSTQQTIGASSAPPQNYDTEFNLASTGNNLGKWPSGSQYLNGYMTEVNFIDGQALTPSSFGYTNPNTGVWSPLAFVGSYGTNGFYLNFSDNSNTTAATLGADYSGNGNNWTPNNFSVTAGAGNDSLVDSPTSYGVDTGVGGTVRGNYLTLNPLDKGSNITLANGNLDWSGTLAGLVRGTIAAKSDKYYFECVASTSYFLGFALTSASASLSANPAAGAPSGYWGWAIDDNSNNFYFYSDGTNPFTASRATSAGDVYQLAVDATSSSSVKLWVGVNNTWYNSSGGTTGNPATGANPTVTITSGVDLFPSGCNTNSTNAVSMNFGQRPFAYTAPSGFKALCTQNLPTPTIGATTATQANLYFNPVLYTGNGSAPRTITGVGFQPDLVWVKSRSNTYAHFLWDAVRGTNLDLFSNLTAAEANVATGSTDGGVSTSASDGFTLTAGTSTSNNVNNNGSTYVGWSWKANGSGSTNTAGSITSTVSANTTSGFSVVTYTGATSGTVGHGLGVSPAMIIAKSRSNTTDWTVYHQSLGINAVMVLSGTNPVQTISNYWGSSTPSSTVFGLWSSSGGNNTGTMVAYCFAPIAGYSAFGSYTGNGSTDGPFVFTGFRPAFVLTKRTDSTGDWQLMDSSRDTYNVANKALFPNTSDAETTGYSKDFLSNGFKIRDSGASLNASGGTYIYMAFASAPLKFSLAR